MTYVTYLQLRHIVGTCEQEISFQTWARRWGMHPGLSHRECRWDIFGKENGERRAVQESYWSVLRFTGTSLVAQAVKNLPAVQETWIGSLGQEDTEIGNGCPRQYFCLENSMDRGAWWDTVHGVAKSRTQLSDWHCHYWVFPGSANGKEHACQCRRRKGCRFDSWVGMISWKRSLATHTSILAQRIPWTEEPGGLQSIKSKESDTADDWAHTQGVLSTLDSGSLARSLMSKISWVEALGVNFDFA